jgi:hypothetical protein
VASTRVALVGPSDRLAAMKTHCATTKVWACIGDMSGQPWSAFGGNPVWQLVHPAYARPDASASGYAVFANAVVAKLDKTTFTNVDLENVQTWGRALESGVPTIEAGDTPPLQQLLLGILRYDLIGVLESEIPRQLKEGLNVLYPEPVGNVAVTAMTRTGVRTPADLASALKDNGWTSPPVSSTGLPDPGLTDAVLAFWKDVKGT